jgi:hypothetical protein
MNVTFRVLLADKFMIRCSLLVHSLDKERALCPTNQAKTAVAIRKMEKLN